MRVLWHSNAPWSPSGYGVQTAHAVRILRELGHEVAVSCSFGLDGGVLNLDGVLTVPGHGPGDPYGAAAVIRNARAVRADVAITLLDAWVFRPDVFTREGVRWAPIVPIDHEPAPGVVREKVGEAWQPLSMTYRDVEVMRGWETRAPALALPHCYDPDVYRPATPDERAAWREKHGVHEDAFVVAVVAANKGYPSRKNLPGIIEAFANFHAWHEPRSVLCLHTELDRRFGGLEVRELLRFFDIPESAVRHSDQDKPASPQAVAALMGAADVMCNPSHGEGFGVPILEAAACGTPSIIGDWTAMREVGGHGALRIPRDRAERFCTLQCAHQWHASPDAILEQLTTALAERGTDVWAERQARCVRHAEHYSLPAMIPVWRETLTAMQARLDDEATALATRAPVEIERGGD